MSIYRLLTSSLNWSTISRSSYEDTRSPDPPNILSGQSAGESLETRVEWRNDANEDGESYYIYRNIRDPFDGETSLPQHLKMAGSFCMDLLYETPQSPNTFLSNVPIEADLERNVWYAVVSEDEFGNLNNEIYPVLVEMRSKY